MPEMLIVCIKFLTKMVGFENDFYFQVRHLLVYPRLIKTLWTVRLLHD